MTLHQHEVTQTRTGDGNRVRFRGSLPACKAWAKRVSATFQESPVYVVETRVEGIRPGLSKVQNVVAKYQRGRALAL